MSEEVTKRNDTGLSLVDLTEIARIEKLRESIPCVDMYSAPLLMRDFMTTCVILAKAIQNVKNALSKAERDMAYEESKALLDRAPAYFAEHKVEGMKDSMTMRQAYVPMDEPFRVAGERRDALAALLRYLEDRKKIAEADHYTVKSIYTKMENPHGGVAGMRSGGELGEVE